MKKLWMILKTKLKLLSLVILIVLLSSCVTHVSSSVPIEVPTLPPIDDEYGIDALIDEPQTSYDLMYNALIYEHQYYRYMMYTEELLNYISELSALEKHISNL